MHNDKVKIKLIKKQKKIDTLNNHAHNTFIEPECSVAFGKDARDIFSRQPFIPKKNQINPTTDYNNNIYQIYIYIYIDERIKEKKASEQQQKA